MFDYIVLRSIFLKVNYMYICEVDFMKVMVVPYGFGRYCIIDYDTGELLDDAQGYGYKSEMKAKVGWNYRCKFVLKRSNERDMFFEL